MINPNSPPSSEESTQDQSLQLSPRNEKSKSIPRKGLIVSFVFLALMVGGGATWYLSSNQKEENPAPAMTAQPQALPVKLEILTTGTVENSSTVVGTLEAPRGVTVKSELAGRIIQILVTEGSRVNQGQVMFKLETNDLQAQLAQAQAQLNNAQARLDELEKGSRPEDIAEGKAQVAQAIARLNNAKAGARPEEIAQAQAQIDSAAAELALAQQRVTRYDKLLKEGAIAQDNFDEIVKTEKRAQAALTEAKRRLDALRKGRTADLRELEGQVEAAQQNLKRLENGPRIEEIRQAQAQVNQGRAAIKIIEVEMAKTEIVAPFTGVIGDIPVKVGDYIKDQDELTTITENNLLEVNLSIPLENAGKLRLGLPVIIFNGQGERITSGEISFISPNVTENTQLILAKATLNNGTGALYNNSSVQAKIIWNTGQGVLIPATAVSRIGGKTFVFVAEETGENTAEKPALIAKQKLVKLGNLQGNNYQVLEGLKEGDRLVSAGIMNLRDDVPIMPLP